MLNETIFQGTRLAVAGNICRDVKTAPLVAGEHLFHDGETPADFIVETIGGGGANSAMAAASLGADARFAGKVGADALGGQLEAALRRRGVKTFIRHDPRVRTGSSMALTFTNGCRHFISAQPNNNTLAFADLDLAMLAGAGHLLRADLWFSQQMLDEGNARLLQAARDRGLATSLDLNWDPLWGSADTDRIAARKAAVRRVLPLANLVHGNVRELNLFADSPDLTTTLRRLTEWGAEAVVIHLGAEGAGYYSRGMLVVEPCAPVSQRVNTTGTGDLLSVCLMLLHARQEIPISEKLALANRIVAEFIDGRREVLPAH
jgi:sugar/nucleoside kinase (ribokinase family)